MSVVAQGLDAAQLADLAAWYAAMEVTVTLPERRPPRPRPRPA
jgi:cytochrome c553